MDASTGSILVALPWNDVLPRVRCALEDAGFRGLVTFDLQLARSRGADWSCPHHAAAPCDCQLVVLMIYGEGVPPASLMLQGTDGRTRIALPGSLLSSPDDALQATIGTAIRRLQAAEGL